MGSYSRTAYLALRKETTEGTALTPNVFIPLLSEDIVTEWGDVAAQPVANNRALNIRSVGTAIPAPTGTITLQVEPRNLPHFLLGVGGAVTTGRYVPITSPSAAFTVGETITGGSSACTATVTAYDSEGTYILSGAPSTTFTDAETITGSSSASTATVTKFDTAAYGHQFLMPQTTDETYTVEIGFDNEAYRYTGVRFNAITYNQSDNVLTLEVTITARYEFKHARVTAVTTSGAGAKTITVDQTTGLVASDSIKLYRPSTSTFQDFQAASDQIHTINAVSSETAFTITDLQVSTVVGDLIVLSPQTPSYAVGNELAWIGQSVVTLSTTMDLVLSAGTTESIEDFELTIENAIEPRHAANGINVKDRFPATSFLAGFQGSGSISRTYTDPEFLDKLRKSRRFAMRVLTTGAALPTATDFNFLVDIRIPDALHQPFNPSISNDDLLNQEMPFELYYNSTDGFALKVLVVNENTAY